MTLDPAYFFYSDGTITLTNGSDIATGSMVAWDPAVLPFDFVYPNDGTAGITVIKEVLAANQIRLAKPWAGPTLTDVPYFMVRWANHTDPRFYAVRVSEYLARLKAIPDNLDEVAAGIHADREAVEAAMTTLAAIEDAVDADRQSVSTDRAAVEASAAAAAASAEEAEAWAQAAGSTVLPDNSVTNVKLADVPANTMKGRVTAGAGDPEDLTPAQALSIIEAATGPLVGFRNRIINGNFAVNQRGYVSGTAVAAAARAHDRWKAGAGGCTYTFPAGSPDTTITITAGSLQQVIAGYNVDGGTFTLSWSGTAQARVAINGNTPSGAYATSPIVINNATPGLAMTVEFSTGTVGKVQVNPGSAALAFERRQRDFERWLCKAYYQPIVASIYAQASAGSQYFAQGYMLPVEMRAPPALTMNLDGTASNVTSPAFDNPATTGFRFVVQAIAAGALFLTNRTGYAEAEL